MNYRVLSFLLLVALALTGCRLDSPRPPTPDVVQILPTPDAIDQAGRLAYIGLDGNVYVTSPDQTSRIAITDDATAAPENTGFSYHRVSWSPGGQLAFAGVERSGDSARSILYVTDPPTGPARVVARNDQHFVIYIYWSPVPCSKSSPCQRLAYLIEEEDRQIGLHLVTITDDEVEPRLVGLGRPFFFSWMADGRQMLWHTGGAFRHNPAAQLTLYQVTNNQARVLPQKPGLFYTPSWSGQDERWLAVSTSHGIDRLQIFGADQAIDLAEANDNTIVFGWSPQADRVAYAVRKSATDPVYDPIQLYDFATGQSRQITDAVFRIAAFFWSPDGQKIAYIKQDSPTSDWLQWRVYDLSRNLDRGFQAFRPSAHMEYVLGSFNQYAQSHRFWSPDSRYLIYAERDNQRVDRVQLVDTWAERGALPLFIAEGTIGFWSWD